MASLAREPNGGYRIQIIGRDRIRRSIRLGKVTRKTADEVRLRIEHLHALSTAGLPFDSDLAAWLAKISDTLAAKIAAAGLMPSRDSRTLTTYLTAFADRRRPSAKPGTMATIQTVTNDLLSFFPDPTDLRAVTVERADEFKTHYQTRTPKLAAATVARRLRMVKMFFRDAVRWNVIDVNPFADVSSRSSSPEDRKHYISIDVTRQILAACSPPWRMIVALSRLAGLRCPSEVLSLKWSDVNFETNRITAPSPKTEHLEGRAYRVLPIFAELRPHLAEAFDLAADGAEYVVSGNFRAACTTANGWQNVNLRTTFLKIIKRAGLKPWPRLFHNLRASCETDLMQQHPIHVVTSWMGNTPTVALKHYLQTLDRDFDAATGQAGQGKGSGADRGARAVQNAVQAEAGSKPQETAIDSERLESQASYTVPRQSAASCGDEQMTLWGLEPTANSACNSVVCPKCGAEIGSLLEKKIGQQVPGVEPAGQRG